MIDLSRITRHATVRTRKIFPSEPVSAGTCLQFLGYNGQVFYTHRALGDQYAVMQTIGTVIKRQVATGIAIFALASFGKSPIAAVAHNLGSKWIDLVEGTDVTMSSPAQIYVFSHPLRDRIITGDATNLYEVFPDDTYNQYSNPPVLEYLRQFSVNNYTDDYRLPVVVYDEDTGDYILTLWDKTGSTMLTSKAFYNSTATTVDVSPVWAFRDIIGLSVFDVTNDLCITFVFKKAGADLGATYEFHRRLSDTVCAFSVTGDDRSTYLVNYYFDPSVNQFFVSYIEQWELLGRVHVRALRRGGMR